MPKGMYPIYTRTIGAGGATSITFNNIPQTYTDLKLVVSARSTGTNGTFAVHFNGDTTNTNYSAIRLYGASTFIASSSFSAPFWLYANYSGNTANVFSSGELNIPNYTSFSFKQISSDVVNENNATASDQFLSCGLWRNNAPVTSIRLSQVVDTGVVEGSTFTLYGISR